MFQTGMHDAVVQRVELAADLACAVDRRELTLHYQPLVSLATGRLAGVEALLRWNHPTLGLLAPAQFMDLAEETGAIVPIGKWVVDEACRQSALWSDLHPDFPFTMSVNVSPKQLHDGAIVETVRSALRRWEIQPSQLVLELTEGVMPNDSELTVGRLHELKGLGVMLAIDDFGTGYSSLSYLRRLPFDCRRSTSCSWTGSPRAPPNRLSRWPSSSWPRHWGWRQWPRASSTPSRWRTFGLSDAS